MRYPELAENLFVPDRVARRELLATAEAFRLHPDAVGSSGACRFSSSRSLTVVFQPERGALSGFNQLSPGVLNCCADPLPVGIKLTHGPLPSADPGRNTSFTGGRELVPPGCRCEVKFPLECFGRYGAHSGWSDVSEIAITFAWPRDRVGPEEIEVELDGLFVEDRLVARGPRLTIEGLGQVLARDVDGVTAFFPDDPVRSSVPQSPQGSPALRVYSGENEALFIPPPHPYPIDRVDEILRGRIMGQHIGMPVPWDADPLGVQEWTHFLNRHHFVREIVKALAQTGEQSYAVALDELVASWIRTNPVPLASNGGSGPSWETLSAAWRLREWLWIAGIGWQHPAFSRETRILMLRSIWEHARSLVDHLGHPNNWLVVESAALVMAGLCFPEFREANQWVETGMDRLSKEWVRQFFDDGVHFEISPLYHAICMDAFLEVMEGCKETGITLPGALHTRTQRMAQFLATLCRPDFTWPSINDSWGCVGDYCSLLSRAGHVLERPEFSWIGTRGSRGSPPCELSRAFPDAGIATMRSHWGPDANFLVFRAGPAGAYHMHSDRLSLDVSAMGVPRLVDPGITSYGPDPLTAHYRSSMAHNTIFVGRKGLNLPGIPYADRIRPAGPDFHWRAENHIEVATGACYGPWQGIQDRAAICRSVIFIGGRYWVVRDLVRIGSEQEITACWQFFPGRVQSDLETSVVEFVDARGWGMKLVPLLGPVDYHVEIASGLASPPRGWVSMEGTDFPACSMHYSIRPEGPATLIWLIVPWTWGCNSRFKAGRSLLDDGADSIELLLMDGTRDSIILHHPQFSELNGLHGDPHGNIIVDSRHIPP